ncbi:hypothetical protein BH10ACI1_BH10ACI1_34540 [soil metagenome]
MTLFVNSSESQTSKEKLSKKERKLKSLEVSKGGCPWVAATTIERRKPSDLIGVVTYGFRGLFGKNKILIVDYNCPPTVKNISLSQTEIISCRTNSNTCSEKQLIEVLTEATDPENDFLTYSYTVTGGKIVGDGAKVVWDLSGVAPGIYTITVGADDGCGICGPTMTKTVKIIE